jgi:RND family efflux transporter MFP subunit
MPNQLLLALPLAAWLLGACGKRQTEAAAVVEPLPVRAAAMRIEAQPFQATVAITGTLVSTTEVQVKAETLGKIVRFTKQEGDRVQAGEPVVWVDDSNEKIALRQAETAVQVAAVAVERAKVMESHSALEFVRAQNLLKSGGITDQDYKAAELAGRDSHARVQLASAQLEQARSQLEHARKMLNDSVVRCPVSGEIQARHVNEGAYVEMPTPLFSVVDNGRLELESMVATSDLAPIRPGQRVTFTVNAWPEQIFEGRVVEINPAVQAETRSAKARIRVDNASRRLKAGMFAQGAIVTGIEKQAIIIPASAVYRDDRSVKTSYVFVVESGYAARRSIRIGRERDSELEIVEGLKPGDVVVTEQSIEIAEGVRVEARIAGSEQ